MGLDDNIEFNTEDNDDWKSMEYQIGYSVKNHLEYLTYECSLLISDDQRSVILDRASKLSKVLNDNIKYFPCIIENAEEDLKYLKNTICGLERDLREIYADAGNGLEEELDLIEYLRT